MILLENGRFYTRNHGDVSSMLIRDGLILRIGGPELGDDQIGSITEHYNLGGKVVWPGLTDAHIHLTTYGFNLSLVNCETDSIDECLQRVECAAAQAEKDEWVLGHGWNQNLWREGYGTAAQLDSVSHGHPVFLTAKSLHAAWANTKAMQLAGITSKTTDPQGGRILRDASGKPTGIFLENAENLITGIIPIKTPEEINRAIIKGIESLAKFGVTSIHDFDSFERFEQYQQLENRGLLHLRILKAVPPNDHQKALNAGYHTGMGQCLNHIGPFKFFMDGALGPHTAAMLAPYQDDPGNQGILNHHAEDVVKLSQDILETGSDLTIHAIGDRANLEAVNSFKHIRELERSTGRNPVRLRIEHAQLLSQEILKDFHRLDIHASMQPLHATSDMLMADEYWGARARMAYAWKSLLVNGANLAFGSDAPVESPDPFRGMHAAVTRQRSDGSPAGSGWIPEERITLRQALDAYTTGPSKLNRFGVKTGRLEPGHAADLILLPVDPFVARAQELHQIKPIATMFNGQWVWVDQGIEL